MIQTRFLSLGGISAFDLAALRFSFAALFLLPVTIKQGLIFNGGSVVKSFILTTCLGCPYMLLVASGMQFAPAAHGASIINGALVLASAFFSYLFIKEKPTAAKFVGLLFIIMGLILLTSYRVNSFNRGHFLFMAGGILWGLYSVLVKKWKADPLHATAIVGTLSAIFYLPIYLVFLKSDVNLAASSALMHGIYQGVFASGIALFLFSYGVSILGASTASLYMPIVPVLTTILAGVILHEWPSRIEAGAIVLIVVGFTIAIGKFRYAR